MIEAEKEEFCSVVAAMAVVYGRTADAPLFAGWWMAMRDWKLADFQAAASLVMKTAKFMPTPATFHELRKAGQKTPGEAWREVLARCDCWRTGERFNDRIERAAQAVGGYRAIAMADIDTALPHLERRFKTAFEELSDVEETRAALPGVTSAGAIEHQGVPRIGNES